MARTRTSTSALRRRSSTSWKQAQVQLHPTHPTYSGTTVWGFDGHVPGPLFRVKYGKPAMVRFYNQLPNVSTPQPFGITGYGLAWTLVLNYPLMTAFQEFSARIGLVTGFGIAGNLRRHYPPWLGDSVVVLLLLANLCPDLGAMGAALKLSIHGLPCSTSRYSACNFFTTTPATSPC
jgi:Natural resistance-associated macrophage protein/Multicopper oxidase